MIQFKLLFSYYLMMQESKAHYAQFTAANVECKRFLHSPASTDVFHSGQLAEQIAFRPFGPAILYVGKRNTGRRTSRGRLLCAGRSETETGPAKHEQVTAIVADCGARRQ